MAQQKMRIDMSVEADSIAVELYLNDICLIAERGDRPVRYSAVLNEWLNTGENQIHVRLEAVPPPVLSKQGQSDLSDAPSQLDTQVPPPRFEVSVRKGDMDDPTQPNMHMYIWPNKDQLAYELPVSNLPSNRRFNVDVPGLGPWSWNSALPIRLNDKSTEMDMARVFAEIYAGFRDKDIDKLVVLSKVRTAERARSFGDSVQEFEQATRRRWERLISKHDFALRPIELLKPQLLKFLPHAGGRLVQLLNLDGRPPIQTKPPASGGAVISYDIYLANLKGIWTWVR